MIPLAKRILRRLLLAAALVPVAAAVLVTGLRLVLPWADGWREEALALLSRGLQVEATASALAVGLSGLAPQIELRDLVLADPASGERLGSARVLRLTLDLPAILRLGKPVPRSVSLQGAEVTLRRHADGHFWIDGLDALRSDDPRATYRFMSRGRVYVTDSRVRLQDEVSGLALPVLADLRLTLVNRGRAHRLALAARPLVPERGGGAECPADAQLRLLAEVSGDAEDFGTWAGDWYGRLAGDDLPALVPAGLLRPGALATDSAMVEVWGDLGAGALDGALARVGLRGLVLAAGPATDTDGGEASGGDVPALGIGRLSGLVRLARDSEPGGPGGPRQAAAAGPGRSRHPPGPDTASIADPGVRGPGPDAWRLSLRDLALSVDGADLPDLDLDLVLVPGPAGADGSDRDAAPAWRLAELELAAGAFDLGRLLGPAERLASRIPPLAGTDWRARLRPATAGGPPASAPDTLAPPIADALARLWTLRPRGRIEGLAVALALPPGSGPGAGAVRPPGPGDTARRPPDLEPPARARWRAALTGRGLAVDRSDPVPGLAGLDVSLVADQDGGTLRIASQGLDLDLAPSFDRPLHLDRLSGRLAWTHLPGGRLRLVARRVVLENADLGGRGRLDLTLVDPFADGGASLPLPGSADPADPPLPFLDLRMSFWDGNGASTRTYVPAGIVNPELAVWLEQAILAGRIPRAELVLRGPLDAFPFRENEGRFELALDFEQGTLAFMPDWPPIEEARGNLRFRNQGLTVRLDGGRILHTRIETGHAGIPDLWDPRTMPIRAAGEGPIEDGLRLMRETPLAEQLGPLGRALEGEGRARLVLDLKLDFEPGAPMGVAGRLSWPPGAVLHLKDTPLTLRDLSGLVTFTEDSLASEGLAARLWERPVALTLETLDADDPEDARTRVSARGRLAAADLAERFAAADSRPLWALARGESDWSLAVDIENADLARSDLPMDFRLAADLKDLALELPDPLGKPAGKARPLALAGSLVPGRSLSLRGTLGDLGLALAADLGQTVAGPGGRGRDGAAQPGPTPGLTLDRARLSFGAGEAPELPPPRGAAMVVDGRLARLDLAAWADWWESSSGQRTPAGPSAELDLAVERLALGGPVLTAARLAGHRGADGALDLRVESRELAGRLSMPAAGSPNAWDLGLERLDLKALLPDAEDAGGSPAPGAPRPMRRANSRSDAPAGRPLPPLDLRIADLRFGAAALGRLAFELRPDDMGLELRSIDLDAPGDSRARGDAQWTRGEAGGRTRLALDFSSADTAPLLRALDYAPALSPAPIRGSLELAWPDGPEAFSLARAEGHVDLEVGAGRLLEVEPGVGRILGFLNLGALRRRLALDFRDLYQQGFAFEEIRGTIRIGGGRADLQTFEIAGPASDIRISGSTDLKRRTFDQTVTVEPKLGSGVAIAGAVAGGPVVGAAVYLADKLAGGAFDRLGTYSYRVTGPWAEPQLIRNGWEPFAGGGAAAGPGPDDGADGNRGHGPHGAGASGRDPRREASPFLP